MMRELKGNWKDIFNGFMVALDLRKLLLALVGVILSLVPLSVITYFIGRKITIIPDPPYSLDNWLNLVFLPSLRSIYTWDATLAFAFTVFVVLVLNVIWSYFGGAITRIAAIEIAKDERIETQKALAFSYKKFRSCFWSLGACALGFGFFFACNYAGGLVGRIPYAGEILVAIALPLAILSGFIMVLIGIGTVCGFPLFFPAVSAEGTDAFDAISRGFSYVYSRPWHFIWYQFVSVVYGAVSVAFTWAFSAAMITMALYAGMLGMGQKQFRPLLDIFQGTAGFRDVSPTFAVAGVIFSTWLVITLGLSLCYVISYFFSSQSIIYFLLRKKVDGIEMAEVFEEKEEDEEFFKDTAPKTEPEKAPAQTPTTPPAAPDKPAIK
jgi:hypothetical protein